jgi:hypothetical protein
VLDATAEWASRPLVRFETAAPGFATVSSPPTSATMAEFYAAFLDCSLLCAALI